MSACDDDMEMWTRQGLSELGLRSSGRGGAGSPTAGCWVVQWRLQVEGSGADAEEAVSVAQGKCSAKALCEGGLEEETEEQQ